MTFFYVWMSDVQASQVYQSYGTGAGRCDDYPETLNSAGGRGAQDVGDCIADTAFCGSYRMGMKRNEYLDREEIKT